MDKGHNKILWIVFLTIFIDMLGIGILIPVFPLLIIKNSVFNIIPSSWTSSDAFIMSGWLLAVFPLAQFIFTPLLGQISDKYGRKKILIFSISGTVCSYILFALAIYFKNIPLMFISRILDGASGGNISIAQAIIGDISSADKRARNFGFIGMALGLGFILGPFLGGKLSDPSLISWFNATTPFYFAAIIGMLNILLVLKFLPETLQNNLNNKINFNRSFYNIFLAFRSKQLSLIILVVFLFNVGFTFYTTFWGVVLTLDFNFKQGDIGNFFAYLGIMIVLAQGIVVRRLSGRVQDYIVLRYSIIGAGLCIMTYYIIKNSSLIYCIPPLLAICMALSKAFSNSLIVRITSTNKLGEAMGINSSATALANAIPAIAAGYIISIHTRLPILVGSIFMIIAGVIFHKFFTNDSNNV